MAIVIDKEEKRRNIALACEDLLITHGIKNISVSQIATSAGIGKGTVYEYFSSKEDIVFEIITIFKDRIRLDIEAIVAGSQKDAKAKLQSFLLLIFAKKYSKELQIYREFIGIALDTGNSKMLEYRNGCVRDFEEFMEMIVDDALQNKKMLLDKEVAMDMIKNYHSGLIVNFFLENIDVQSSVENFVNHIIGK